VVASLGSAEVARDVTELLGRELQRAIDEVNTGPAKLLLRFAAELCRARVADTESFVRMLEALIAATTLGSDAPDPIGDWAFHLAALTVAWSGAMLSECDDGALARIVRDMSVARQASGRDWLAAEWSAVMQARDTNAWGHCLELSGVIQQEHQQLPVASFAPLSASSLAAIGKRMPQSILPPEPLGLFPDSHPQLEGMPAHERLLLEDCFADVAIAFSESAAEAAKFLLAVPQPTARPPARALLVETLLSHLLAVPPLHGRPRSIFYGALLVLLTKQERAVLVVVRIKRNICYLPSLPLVYSIAHHVKQMVVVAKQFVEAVRTLFGRLEEMDIEQSERFAEWFAWHLSNFEFLWSWDQW